MPISNTSRKAGPFPGNGVAKTFSFNFKIFDENELRVSLTSSSGVEQVLAFNVNYTVDLNPDQDADAGGVVTLNTAPPSGSRLVILSNIEALQPIDMTNQGGFYPETVNEGLDRTTALIQQIDEKFSRAVTVPPSSPEGTDLSLPEPAEGQLLVWGPRGLMNLDPSTLISVVAYGSTRVDKFDSDGTQVSFVLSGNAGAENNLRVSVDGVMQTPGEDFFWMGGANIQFGVAPPAGTRIVVQYQEALLEIGAANADAGNIDPAVWRTVLGVPEPIASGVVFSVDVPSQYPTVAAAVAAAEKYQGPGGVFNIRVAPGTYVDHPTVSINKPLSVQLRIVGNAADPSTVKFQYTGNSKTALVCTHGGSTSVYVNGITLEHTNINDRLNTIGIMADENGMIHLGGAVVVEGFFWNLFARYGGTIRADSGGKYRYGGDTNALAYIGGNIKATGCDLSGADDLLSTLGSGAVCEGGALDVSFSQLNGSKRAGLHCIEGYVRAMDTTFSNNVNNGIAQDGGHIDLTHGCTASNNGQDGLRRNAGQCGGELNGTGNGGQLRNEVQEIVRPADPNRSRGLITVPEDGRWHDNVLAIQNKSIGYFGPGETNPFSGNAAWAFLDRAGTEKGAIGYSRNAALAPHDGFVADTVYVEIGNPFATDNPSDFRLIVTMKVGSPYWGGVHVGYDAMHVNSKTGDITFSSNNSSTAVTRFRDNVMFGRTNVPRVVGFNMGTVVARIRERGTTNQLCIATNVQNMADIATDPIIKDDNAVPSWSMGFGGADRLIVHRAPPGAGQTMVEVFSVDHDGLIRSKAAGNPEGVVTSSVGGLWPSSNGKLYFKATGTGNTGWREVAFV